MVKGLGNDIVEIDRIRNSIARHDKHFVDKIFTAQEQAYCNKFQDSLPHYAGRFAAKEAVAKALGTGFRNGLGFLDIEISNDLDGKPYVIFSKKWEEKLDFPQMLVSISHSKLYAIATAIWL